MVEDTVVTPTQEEPAAIREDQAEGLRSMFSPAGPRMICMACALDADTAARQIIAAALARRKHAYVPRRWALIAALLSILPR